MKKIFLCLLLGIAVFCCVRQFYERLLKTRYAQRERTVASPVCRRVSVPENLLNDLRGATTPAIYQWIALQCSKELSRRLYIVEDGRYHLEDLGTWVPSPKNIYFATAEDCGWLFTGERAQKVLKLFQKDTHIFALDAHPRLHYGQ